MRTLPDVCYSLRSAIGLQAIDLSAGQLSVGGCADTGVMTEVAYMVRADWGQRGTGMTTQSAIIRAWLGGPPFTFAVSDERRFGDADHDADAEAAGYIDSREMTHVVINIRQLPALSRDDGAPSSVVVLHPFEERDLEAIRKTTTANSVSKLFVLVWSGSDSVRTWLDGVRAIDLHTSKVVGVDDPLLLAAAKMIKREDYNGLSSGRGKDAVVQLVRAFAAEGYPVAPQLWLRAYFAVGGDFRHASALQKLVQEMQSGIKHRVKSRYRDNIVAILRDQIADGDDFDDE